MALTTQEITNLYINQLGREPTAQELSANANKAATALVADLNRSVEGQNFDTQYLTSQYRQLFARNPEQEGFQYWLSEAQNNPELYGEALRNMLIGGAGSLDAEAYARTGSAPMIPGGYTDFISPDLEADPYGGRYATTSIYDLPADAVNVSNFYGNQAQFVAPVTQRPVITNYAGGGKEGWTANTGLDVLSAPVVSSAVSRALNSGAMSQAEYETMVTDLTKAGSMTDVYAAFNKPQSNVVMDAVYGLQTGQGNTLAEAQTRAADIQPLIDSINQGYYPSNMNVATEAQNQGVNYAFGPEAYQGYNTMMGQGDVVNDANFKNKVNQVLQDLYGNYGGTNNLQTPLSGGYYSERGLESGYTPLGVAGNPVFRSGVAGYTPNLPTQFQFGNQPINAVVPQFIPGQFTTQLDANGKVVVAAPAEIPYSGGE
jgi:hypothetical protein